MQSELGKIDAEYHEMGKNFIAACEFVKISKPVDVFSKSFRNIQVLHPKFTKICDYLWRHSVQAGFSSHSYGHLNHFVKALQVMS